MYGVVKVARVALVSITLVATLGLPMATAQKRGDKKLAEPRPKQQSLAAAKTLTTEQQAALYVLDQLSEAAKKFDDELLKLRTQAQVGDLLWSYDEPRARRRLEEAFRATTSIKVEKQGATVPPPSPVAPVTPLSLLQREILSLIARRDVNLAERLINSAAAEAKSETDGAFVARGGDAAGGERPGLYLQAALSIADTNPERSVQLAEASFAGGISPTVLSVLLTLRQKSPTQGDALYRATLAAARRDPTTASLSLQLLAPYALPEFITAAGFGAALTPDAGAATQAGGAAAVEFLNFAYDTFMHLAAPTQTSAANPADYMLGQRLLPFFVKYQPERAPMFRSLLGVIAQRAAQSPAIETVNNLSRPGGADELLKQAEAASDPFQKDLLYFRAVMMAMGEGDFDRAIEIAGRAHDGDFRSGLDAFVRFQASSSLSVKGDADAALRYARSMPDVRRRAYLLAKVARTLFDKKDTARAAEVLAEARQSIAKADEGAAKAQAWLIVAEIETRLDPARGFEGMEATVKAFNSIVPDASGEVKPAPGAGFVLSSMLTKLFKLEQPDFAPSFSLLARADFERAVQLAQTLKQQDLSVQAQLAACRSVLVKRRE
ncbi:MAG: hypothetical protein QOD32_970 [Pyrinomonadaceae bacterium]|jgi:hypothetical protein|nr:hypothetical protein [Pyrinomonadaceae bacterium]